MTSYDSFIASKTATHPPTGFLTDAEWPHLFPFQADLVRWALARGRSAIFANTGLGKTRMQLTFADEVARRESGKVLILAPLAVGAQTIREAIDVGIGAGDLSGQPVSERVVVTNYEKLHKVDPDEFVGVVLDESSIIKHHDSKTLALLMNAFQAHAFKLACTATPAPNDWVELGTHAEFLGVCTRAEMLSEFFVHDGGETQKWRLKGHAKDEFWPWVASWGAMIRHPADLGYQCEGYDLPPMDVFDHVVSSGDAHIDAGFMFPGIELGGLVERRKMRKATTAARVTAAADLVNASSEAWVVWCDLNAESHALARKIKGSCEVTGSQPSHVKEQRLLAFAAGDVRVLVTKPKIAGFGLNWQHCRNICFVGVTDSWESYYQAVRRCWRFGQDRCVRVHLITSDAEGDVLENLRRKDRLATELSELLAMETSDAVKAQVLGAVRTTNDYSPKNEMELPLWLKS